MVFLLLSIHPIERIEWVQWFHIIIKNRFLLCISAVFRVSIRFLITSVYLNNIVGQALTHPNAHKTGKNCTVGYFDTNQCFVTGSRGKKNIAKSTLNRIAATDWRETEYHRDTNTHLREQQQKTTSNRTNKSNLFARLIPVCCVSVAVVVGFTLFHVFAISFDAPLVLARKGDFVNDIREK